MCAIAGMMGGDPARRRELVAFMTEIQKHRGPEGCGFFADREVLLGHRRLAIVELSDAGHQPMRSRDGRWTIVFNGEILNHRDLRRELPGPWQGSSDTEVLVEACAHWGVERALERSAGMFAFAVWDARERELTLARDRYGEKPLVYFWDGRMFAFASELKALMTLHRRRLDPRAMDAYLTLGYIPAPLAAFRNCFKLPAGHLLRFKSRPARASATQALAGNSLDPISTFPFAPAAEPRVKRWWFDREPRYLEEIPNHRDVWVEHLKRHLSRSVEERLQADVPVALALSGGIDSSVIAAECVRQGVRPFAFTVNWPGAKGATAAGDRDLPHAREVARWLDLDLEVIEARPLERELSTTAACLPAYYDEPFSDSSAVGCLALGRALGGRYKVILNGDGGDEAFGGYRHYEAIAAKQRIKRAAALLGLVDGTSPASVYVHSKVLFRSAARRRLLGANGSADTVESVLRNLDPPHAPALEQALWIDRHLPLANALTHKMDIALSAFGIEGRSPFMDHRLVEWARALPPHLLVRGRGKKMLLRAAYAPALPPQVFQRPKQGFGAPVGLWLEGPLREWARDLVPCPWFEKPAQRGLAGQQLWALAGFSQWARHWNVTW